MGVRGERVGRESNKNEVHTCMKLTEQIEIKYINKRAGLKQ